MLLTASFTLAVDFSILNVALPTIGADVGFSLADLQWIATAFALCAAGFTLFFGRIADLFGRRRLFLLGIACSGSRPWSAGWRPHRAVLLVARVAQGLATAAVTPAALSLLTTSFPEGPRTGPRRSGLNGALMAAGFTTGAILGGVLTDLLSWRWAFFINVVVAVAVLVVAPGVLTESRPDRAAAARRPRALTVTAGTAARRLRPDRGRREVLGDSAGPTARWSAGAGPAGRCSGRSSSGSPSRWSRSGVLRPAPSAGETSPA